MTSVTVEGGKLPWTEGSEMVSDQAFIAAAREAYIAEGTETAGIRPATLAAWRRSKAAGVAPTGHLNLEMHDDFDRDSSLLRAVRPITEDLMRQFHASDVAMMVTDRDARIVGRWTTGALMQRHLDRMGVHPGAIFDESYVGSTGLGTALEDGFPAVVEGAEHYNDSFDAVVAVGAPIIHPGSGVVEGVMDVVSPTGAPVGLMLPLISRAVREAGDRLVSGYAREDRELLDAFMQTERRGFRRPMIALNSRLMLANTHAGELLCGQPHALRWGEVQRAIVDGHEAVLLGERGDPAGLVARIRKVSNSDGCLGAVLQLGPAPEISKMSRRQSSPARALSARVTSVLGGHSLRWVGAIQTVADALVRAQPVLVIGPAGSGKSILASTSARLWAREEDAVGVVDAGPDLASTLDSTVRDVRVVVVDAVERADEHTGDLLDWIDRTAETGVRVVVTLQSGKDREVPESVAARIPTIVELPSLAHRVADIGDLVQAWSARQEDGGCAVESDALHELMRRPWAGNVRQLFRTLDIAASNRTGSKIHRENLPEATAHNPRRQLTYLENVEREAIAKLLAAAGGRKIEVARELGISRSTLYRKLAALGLDD